MDVITFPEIYCMALFHSQTDVIIMIINVKTLQLLVTGCIALAVLHDFNAWWYCSAESILLNSRSFFTLALFVRPFPLVPYSNVY